jgi:hypothetical protein
MMNRSLEAHDLGPDRVSANAGAAQKDAALSLAIQMAWQSFSAIPGSYSFGIVDS